MGLTGRMEQELNNLNLVELFNSQREVWISAAKRSYGFLKQEYINQHLNLPIWPDDISEIMFPLLRKNTILQEFLTLNGLNADYWTKCFSYYIVAYAWKEITSET